MVINYYLKNTQKKLMIGKEKKINGYTNAIKKGTQECNET